MTMPTQPEGEPQGQGGPSPVAPYASRTAEFGNGTGQAPPQPTPSDEQNQMQANAGPRPYQATGTNQQLVPSGMGSAPADQQRMLMGGSSVHSFLPAANGMSQSTYQQIRPLLNSTISK